MAMGYLAMMLPGGPRKPIAPHHGTSKGRYGARPCRCSSGSVNKKRAPSPSALSALEAEVGPCVAQRGKLEGLVIVAQHIPGWYDLSAVISPLRFVHEHHRKVRRVALVTNDRLTSVLPRIAAALVDARLRSFRLAKRAATTAWLAGSPEAAASLATEAPPKAEEGPAER